MDYNFYQSDLFLEEILPEIISYRKTKDDKIYLDYSGHVSDLLLPVKIVEREYFDCEEFAFNVNEITFYFENKYFELFWYYEKDNVFNCGTFNYGSSEKRKPHNTLVDITKLVRKYANGKF